MHCHNSLLSPALKFRSVDYYVWAGYNFVSVLLRMSDVLFNMVLFALSERDQHVCEKGNSS